MSKDADTQGEAIRGVAILTTARDSDPKREDVGKALPRIIVALPEGSITCKAGQPHIANTKKGKGWKKNSVAAGGRRVPSFSRTLGGLSPAILPK